LGTCGDRRRTDDTEEVVASFADSRVRFHNLNSSFGALHAGFLGRPAFLGIQNATNILIADRPAWTNVANPGAVGGNGREFFFIDGCLNTFYFYRYLLVWFFFNDPQALRDAISFCTTLLPERQFL